MAEKVKMLRDHGQARKYYHDVEGYNGRLDAVQAGILRLKLGHLGQWSQERREHAQRYNESLRELDNVITPFEPSWTKAVYHLYVIRTKQREELQRHLSDAGIASGLHYPLPLHLQKAYKALGYKEGDFPISERVAKEILSLPMYPELTADQIDAVCHEIKAFFSEKLPRPCPRQEGV
jgi:dTDP-4-amino-4,6-dideoxygalactose transaminase